MGHSLSGGLHLNQLGLRDTSFGGGLWLLLDNRFTIKPDRAAHVRTVIGGVAAEVGIAADSSLGRKVVCGIVEAGTLVIAEDKNPAVLVLNWVLVWLVWVSLERHKVLDRFAVAFFDVYILALDIR